MKIIKELIDDRRRDSIRRRDSRTIIYPIE